MDMSRRLLKIDKMIAERKVAGSIIAEWLKFIQDVDGDYIGCPILQARINNLSSKMKVEIIRQATEYKISRNDL